jgi:hypothetical protein
MVPPGKYQVLSNCFSSFVRFRKIDWHASGSATCVNPALFGLLCAWREVLILRQQRPSAASHWSPLHVIHRPQSVGSINMPIRSSCVWSSQRSSVANSAVPSIKPTSADAQLLFSVAGEELARLDIGDHTIYWQHHLCLADCSAFESRAHDNLLVWTHNILYVWACTWSARQPPLVTFNYLASQ